MIARGDRVVYTGERSPDYPDAAYRGTVVAVDGGMVTVRWDACAEWDAEECALPAGELAHEAGAAAMREITLLPLGRYMDGPSKGQSFPAHPGNAPIVKVMYQSVRGYDRVIYELKWWQYEDGRREARYYLTEESAREYRLWGEAGASGAGGDGRWT